MILTTENKECFLLYKHAYDKKLKVDKDISIHLFDEEIGIDILRECLDAIPLLVYEDGYLIDDEGVEHEDVCTFELSHPLITDLGTFEKHLRDKKIDIEQLEHTESFDYYKLKSLIKKESSLISSMCASFFGSTAFFDDSWTTLTIAHEAQMECFDFFQNLLEYLDVLEEMIPIVKKHFDIFKK